jgi:hypothetical protein
MTRTYSELQRIDTFEDRFRYLALTGVVGETTFGFDRHMNQMFYSSAEWKRIRQIVILRDNACDLGVAGYEIHKTIYIHHMNPMVPNDIKHSRPEILDPEFLISVTHRTHNAIHYGDERQLVKPFVERQAGDTKLW